MVQNYIKYTYVLNNPLKYTDPSGYWFDDVKRKKRRFWKHAHEDKKYRDNPHPRYDNSDDEDDSSEGGGGGYSYSSLFSSPFSESGNSSSSDVSGQHYSGGGGGVSGISSSNSEDGSIDAIWVQPPLQQRAIDLRESTFPSQIIEQYKNAGSSKTIQDIIDFSSAGENWEKQIGDWGQISASTKYESNSDNGKTRYTLFDIAGDNYPNGLILIHVATSRSKGFMFRPHEIPFTDIPKLKGNLTSTLQNEQYPYVMTFYFQEFNLKGTYQKNVIGINYLFYDYNSFISIYNLL